MTITELIAEMKRVSKFYSESTDNWELVSIVENLTKQAEQLENPKECEFKFYECTKCGFREEDDYRREEMCFCPCCGTKVRGKNE